MWIWWEYIDPVIGPLFGYQGSSVHNYLNWVTKGMLTVLIPMFFLLLVVFGLYFKARRKKPTVISQPTLTAETMEVKEYGPVTREDKLEVLECLKVATLSALKELEKRYKKKKITEPAYKKTRTTLTLQIQKIENTIYVYPQVMNLFYMNL